MRVASNGDRGDADMEKVTLANRDGWSTALHWCDMSTASVKKRMHNDTALKHSCLSDTTAVFTVTQCVIATGKATNFELIPTRRERITVGYSVLETCPLMYP